ncbi:hypothetical protein [Lyngbya sp. CCY1209]|nr:hypothetical protein [Lyngbya sp. CCY1209]MEB3882632.1 hypothetical protein [Lyngbya sp. CCY1209]
MKLQSYHSHGRAATGLEKWLAAALEKNAIAPQANPVPENGDSVATS